MEWNLVEVAECLARRGMDGLAEANESAESHSSLSILMPTVI